MNQSNYHSKLLLPKNNQRRLTSALYVIEQRLDDLKDMLEQKEEGVMYRLTDLPGEIERSQILSEIEMVKREMVKMKEKYRLEPRTESYTRTASSYISSGIVDLTDILSKGMKGYGKFPDGDLAEEYDKDILHLRDILKKFPL